MTPSGAIPEKAPEKLKNCGDFADISIASRHVWIGRQTPVKALDSQFNGK
jgi:hypothetical protein